MTYFRFHKLMYRSEDPFTIPLELCYIIKQETRKAQEQFVISRPCYLYFLLDVRLDICIASHIWTPNLKIEPFFIMICVKSFYHR